MRIRVLWVGRTKEGWAREAIEKYSGLIRPFAELETLEVKEEKGQKGLSAAAVEAEGRRILKSASSSFVLLDEGGRQASSLELADMLRDRPRLEFVLGGPWGVSGDVREAAASTLSLSRMTLTHDMARIVLLEQIYRGFTIITGRGYHH